MLRHLASLALLTAFVGPAPAIPPDPLLSDDAEFALTINVRALAGSPFFRSYLQNFAREVLTQKEPLRTVWQALAIDPLADGDSLLLSAPASLSGEKYVVVLRGRFNREKLQKAADAWAVNNPTTLQIDKVQGQMVYEFKVGLTSLLACLLDEGTLVITRNRADLDEAIAKKAGKRKPAINKELEKLLSRIDGQATVGVAVVVSPALKKELATSPETEKLFAGLGNAHGSITLGDDCTMRLMIGARDAKTATELRQFAEAVKAILSLAAMDSPKHAPVLTMLVGGLQITSGADGVTIGGKATKEQIEKAIQKAKDGMR